MPLLYGSFAAYRAFYVGMSDGADVGQLTHDLIALGYGAGLTQSDHYSSATAAAVERWQTALGLPATGTVLLGEVVFEPGPIRVTVGHSFGRPGRGRRQRPRRHQHHADRHRRPGGDPGVPAQAGRPGHRRAARRRHHRRRRWSNRSATWPSARAAAAPAPAARRRDTADQTPCSSSGSGSSSTPTVTVTITLDTTPPGATLDQAPVNVNITTQRADNVLAVPVNALLALQGGGYGVEVVAGGVDRLVGVTTGLYSNTLVQISGAGITAGTLVEVPSS